MNELTHVTFALGIGSIGYTLFVISSYFQNRIQLLAFEAVGCLLLALQWHLLSYDIAVIINLAYSYVAVCGIFMLRYSWVKYAYALVFPAILIAYVMCSDGAMMDVLVVVASVPCLAVRYLQNMSIIRGVALSSSTLWLVVNASSSVYAGMLCNIGYGAGHLLFFIRKYREGKAVKALSINT